MFTRKNRSPRRKSGFTLVETMLYVSIAITVAVLSVTYGAKLVVEQDARNAAAEILILQDTVNQAYSFRTDFAGLTTASFLSTHQAPHFLALADNSGLVIPEIKASLTVADERPSIPGSQSPAYAIFVRDLSTLDCSVIAARLGASFADVIVNGSSVIDSTGFRPDLAAASCSAMQSGNAIKLISERTSPWVACRSLGTQFEEDSCPSGFSGVVTYSREYSCAANGGFEPGVLGARTQTKSVCCLVNAPQTEVRSDCPVGFTGTRTWKREYSCAANAGNEPGAWGAWFIQTDNCVRIPVPGVCGADQGQNLMSAPVFQCSAGTPTAVFGQWTWSCLGLYGGADASCTALSPENKYQWHYGDGCGCSSWNAPNPYTGGLSCPAGHVAEPATEVVSSCGSGIGGCNRWFTVRCTLVDVCLNVPGNQLTPPANGSSSGGNCSCNPGYTLNAATGTCGASAGLYGGKCARFGFSISCVMPTSGRICSTGMSVATGISISTQDLRNGGSMSGDTNFYYSNGSYAYSSTGSGVHTVDSSGYTWQTGSGTYYHVAMDWPWVSNCDQFLTW